MNSGTWSEWARVLTSLNYTTWINTTNFPGLNSTGTVTSIKVGSTSYSPSSGVVSLPAYPTALKSPNAIKFKNTAGTEVSYDGSTAVDLTGGVNNAKKLDGNAETSYLRARGTIDREYVDLTTYTSGAAAYKNYDNGVYSVSETGATSILVHFALGTGSASALELWTNYTATGRIKVRKNIDSNRVSGAWKDLAWYSDIPTKTSQLTNDSGFLTSRGYIGTTAVQASSASQNLTGIGNLTMSGNLTITPGNTDNFITFSYSSGTTYSWRLGYLGSGSGDANYLVIQSAKAAGTSWNNVIRMGNETLDAAFGGNVYPITTNAQTLGTADYQWSHIYGVKGTYTGDLTLYTASGDSPAIVFHRGNLGSDTTVDWRMYVTAGHLKLQNAQSGFNSGAWSDVLHFEGD